MSFGTGVVSVPAGGGGNTFGRPLPGQISVPFPSHVGQPPKPPFTSAPATILPVPLHSGRPPLPPGLASLEGHPYVTGTSGRLALPLPLQALDKPPGTFREGFAAGAQAAALALIARRIAAFPEVDLFHFGGLTHNPPISTLGKFLGPTTGLALSRGALVTDSAALASWFVIPRPWGLLPPRLIGLAPDWSGGFTPHRILVKPAGNAILAAVDVLSFVASGYSVSATVGLRGTVAAAVVRVPGAVSVMPTALLPPREFDP